MKNMNIQHELMALRQQLHQHPEISGEEEKTAIRIKEFIEDFNPDRTVNGIGGYGLLAEFNGIEKGPTVMFRCELDALPVKEKNTVAYHSENPGKAHLCGHDGHMTMVAGLASYLGAKRPKKGRVILLFQPSEEDGQGAKRIIQDQKFKEFEPDYIFAIHNLPGYPMHKVILSNQNFASASRGMAIQLSGKSSHAAEPEKGINPGMGLSKIVMQIEELLKNKSFFKDFVLVTPIHARLGNLAYGTSPGDAEVHFTLRSYLNDDMNILIKKAETIVRKIAVQEKLTAKISYKEIFPATKNNPECSQIVAHACTKSGLSSESLKKPFRWSEDFGHFTSQFPGTLFGLGSGTDQPALHNPDFDFPDELISTGMTLYKSIYENILDS
jgi:amidohydrolase